MERDVSDSENRKLQLERRLFGTTLEAMQARLRYDDRLAKMWHMLEQRYAETDIDLETISNDIGMSKNNLNRLLGELTGLTMGKLLTAYRVYRSLCTGLEKNVTFTQLAFDHGFDNSSSYSRTVRRLLLGSPSRVLRRGSSYTREIELPSLDKEDQR